jgi:tetratricopeptide (TPR) repeat protein
MSDFRSRPLIALAIFVGILCLTIAAYAPVFSAGYVWDDDSWLTGNPAVQDPHGLRTIWTSVPRMQYYPLLFTSYWVEHRLYGFNPVGYHAVNVLLHACNAFLVGLILRSLGVPGAFWVAALFAVHPVHVESVAWVTERKNVLSGFFCLGATLAFLKFERNRRQATYAAALALFVCALLSKTATATLPLALAAVSLWRRWPPRLRDFAPLGPFVVVAVALASITVSLEKDMVAVASPDFGFTSWQRLLIAARAFLFYPSKLLFPYPLIFSYPRFDVASASVQSLWSLGALALLCAGLAILWRNGRRGLASAALVYAVLIFPALGFFDVYAFRFSFVADHFQYLASIALLALVPQAGSWLLGKLGDTSKSAGLRRTAQALAAGLVVALGVLTWNQAHAYRDEATLWKDTIAKNPDSWIAHHNLATLLVKSGDVDGAIAGFTEAIRCKPNAAESYSGRGLAYKRKGRADLALVDLDRAMELDPGYPQAYLNRGEAFAAANRFDEAIDDLDQFLADNPEYGPAYQSRASAYTALGQHDAAIADLDEAIKFGAGATAYRDRAKARLQLGQDAPALVDLERAIELDPSSAELYVSRGFTLVRMQRNAEALTDFDTAARLDPKLAATFVLRGGLYQRIDGNKNRACGEWQHACSLGDCKLFESQCARR